MYKKLKFKNTTILLLLSFALVLLTSLNVKSTYIQLAFSVLLWILVPIKRYWDGIAISLFFFSVFYTIFVVFNLEVKSGFALLTYMLSPSVFYRFGNYLMDVLPDENARIRSILFIGLLYLLPVFMITILDVVEVGIVNVNRIMSYSDSSDEAMAATLYGMMVSYGIGCVYGLFIKKIGLIDKVLYLIILLLSLLTVIHLVNRTGIVIFAVCLIVSFISGVKHRKYSVLSILLMFILFIAIVNYSGIISDEVMNAYIQREDNTSYSLSTAGGRVEIWTDAVKNIFTHPFGWERRHYAHNMWLDIARIGGWFPLATFIIATISYVSACIKHLRLNGDFNSLIVTLNIAMFLASFVEPVIEGSFLFFSLYMMIWGITNRSLYAQSSFSK